MSFFDKNSFLMQIKGEDGAFLALDGRIDENGCGGGVVYTLSFGEQELSSGEDIRIRLLGEAQGEYLAIVNHSPYWCMPVFCDTLSQIPEKTQMFMCKAGERWVCAIPLCRNDFKALLLGESSGLYLTLTTNCRGVYKCDGQPILAVAYGTSALESANLAAAASSKALGGLKLRGQRKYPEELEYFGWCSWDALQIRVNHKGLLEKAREFADKGVPLGFAIIDDMWANVPNLATVPDGAEFMDMVNVMHVSRLEAFEGDPRRFPEGMQAAISDLKELGVKKVGVWFPTTGYWDGLADGGKDATLLSEQLVRVEVNHRSDLPREEGGYLIPSPEKERAERFFRELCGRVKSWGGDFVKIDNQGFHARYENLMPIGRSAANIQRAIDGAVEENFGGSMINCMGMPSECMLSRPSSAVSRCSDDFIPESREWFAKNILQCSYNGLLQGRFYYNDWDMWWTDDSSSKKNSICRAISGGPVYVSDKQGRTRPEILKPLMFSDGRIIRCDDSATPTDDCILGNPTRKSTPFKIRNRIGGSGMVAVFNINEENAEVLGFVCPEDAGLGGDELYAYFEHYSREGGILKAGEKIPVSLGDRDEVKLYTFKPIRSICPLGRVDMLMGAGAIVREEKGRIILYEGGEVGFISERPIRVFAGERELECERFGNLNLVKSERDEKTLDFCLA